MAVRLIPADGKRMRSSVRIVLVASLLALAALAGRVGVPFADVSSAAPIGRDQTLFGMDVPSLEQLDASEAKVGARAAIVGTFADWEHTRDFPLSLARGANERGAVLLISWEPWDSWRGGVDQPAYTLRTVAAGNHDALIDRWANEIARYGRPVMIRFAAEMNGDWLPGRPARTATGPGLRRRLAPRPRTFPPGRCDQRRLGLEPDRLV